MQSLPGSCSLWPLNKGGTKQPCGLPGLEAVFSDISKGPVMRGPWGPLGNSSECANTAAGCVWHAAFQQVPLRPQSSLLPPGPQGAAVPEADPAGRGSRRPQRPCLGLGRGLVASVTGREGEGLVSLPRVAKDTAPLGLSGRARVPGSFGP